MIGTFASSALTGVTDKSFKSTIGRKEGRASSARPFLIRASSKYLHHEINALKENCPKKLTDRESMRLSNRLQGNNTGDPNSLKI